MLNYLFSCIGVRVNCVNFPKLESCMLNSSTIDELGEGAWNDGGAMSLRAKRVG